MKIHPQSRYTHKTHTHTHIEREREREREEASEFRFIEMELHGHRIEEKETSDFILGGSLFGDIPIIKIINNLGWLKINS